MASLEQKIIAHLPTIQELAKEWAATTFDAKFGKLSTVWQTFLMHIIQPDQFPIFDQHVYRAYAYLQTGQGKELKGTITTQLTYYAEYCSFFDQVSRECPNLSPRSLDKAFWAFGKFIKQYFDTFLKSNRKLIDS